ncbi:hypothetical protein MIND_00756100 [Mycena indigotica]|uniref:Uncharacterized protein n=1 Tax=Mycena indigotica TaxID=2126181 RepID=A0A8H6SNI7_9AGAR|nr:uncharacterized protein MIND_00756100 [Mycena indigotica]KAF7301901.1 hypothetical protein MIND_00756100 [Mycena indigotica]
MSQKVEISVASFVDLSKSTVYLTSCKCEAPAPATSGRPGATPPCGHPLASWKAYSKHLCSKHVNRKNWNGTKSYRCKATRCSANALTSYKMMKTHIEATHMKTVPLVCPMVACRPLPSDVGRAARLNVFYKERDLVSHLHEVHGELVGQMVDPELLLPSYRPKRPATLEPPPPLPNSPLIPWPSFRLDLYPSLTPRSAFHLRNGHVSQEDDGRATPMRRTQSPSPQPTPSSSLNTPNRNKRLLSRTATEMESIYEESRVFSLDDLPPVAWKAQDNRMDPVEAAEAPFFVVQPLLSMVDLVRPLDLPTDREYKDPPRSIFHEALTKQVMAKSARGEG